MSLSQYPSRRDGTAKDQGQNKLAMTSKQGEKQKQEFKLTTTKLLSYRTKCQNVQDLVSINTQSNINEKSLSTVQQLRIMHSQYLSSLKGITIFKLSLTTVNLSSNVIDNIQGLQSLTQLQTIQMRNNKIKSLKGIQKCQNLVKIDVSNNLLATFDGLKQLSDRKNKLQKISLAGNYFQDLEQLQFLAKLQKLKQIIFTKGKTSNPFCQNYGDYIFIIHQLISNKNVLIDDQKLGEHLKILNMEISNNLEVLSRHHPNNVIDETSYEQDAIKQSNTVYARTMINPSKRNSSSHNGFQRTPSLNPYMRSTQNNQLLMTQQQLFQTQEVLSLKNEQIQDLKYKNSQLQIQHTTQYKDLIKKQTDFQRLQGQNHQLYKQMQKKQKSLSQMHKRVEQMLKSSTQTSKLLQSKNKQIDRLKDDMNLLRIQSAEHKALAKDYQKRLSQIHQKTLLTIQQRTLKQDELKRKYEQIHEQNYRISKQKQEMKDRIRELSELLREWEFKYESKINELQARQSYEREELLRQAEEKISQTTRHYEHQLQKMDDDMRNKVGEIQDTYKHSLEEAYERHKKLKAAYEQRSKNQHQMKIFLKSALEKNQQQQSLIQQFQQIVIRLKGQLSSVYEQKQQKSRQLSHIKYRHAQQNSSLEQKMSKLSYEKSRLEKQLMDIRQTNTSLLSENQNQMKFQKLYEQLEQKFEDVQTSLDVKKQMLEDKNQTIESMKQEIQMIQRETADKVDGKDFDSLRKKYEKSKKQSQILSEQTNLLMQQNDELKKQNEDCKLIVLEFEKMKETLTSYEKAVQEKDAHLQQLVRLVEQCKKVTSIERQQLDQYKRQYKRLEQQSQNRQRNLRDQVRQIQAKHRRELDGMKVQNQKYRKNALEQLQSVFLKLQK